MMNFKSVSNNNLKPESESEQVFKYDDFIFKIIFYLQMCRFRTKMILKSSFAKILHKSVLDTYLHSPEIFLEYLQNCL